MVEASEDGGIGPRMFKEVVALEDEGQFSRPGSRGAGPVPRQSLIEVGMVSRKGIVTSSSNLYITSLQC